MTPLPVTVVVLCGGQATRFQATRVQGAASGFQGAASQAIRDKTAARFGGQSVLSYLLGSLPATWPVVAVGTLRPLRDASGARLSCRVRWCRERPRHGGPVAALTAGLHHVDTPCVAVVGGDMPLAGTALRHLADTLATCGPHIDAVVGHTPDGRPQPLLLVAHTDALRAALTPAPRRLREVVAGLRVQAVPVDDDAAADVDTPADLTALARRVEA